MGDQVGSRGGAAFDLDVAEDLVLPHHELVHFHELQEGQEGYDHLRFGAELTVSTGPPYCLQDTAKAIPNSGFLLMRLN